MNLKLSKCHGMFPLIAFSAAIHRWARRLRATWSQFRHFRASEKDILPNLIFPANLFWKRCNFSTTTTSSPSWFYTWFHTKMNHSDAKHSQTQYACSTTSRVTPKSFSVTLLLLFSYQRGYTLGTRFEVEIIVDIGTSLLLKPFLAYWNNWWL